MTIQSTFIFYFYFIVLSSLIRILSPTFSLESSLLKEPLRKTIRYALKGYLTIPFLLKF